MKAWQICNDGDFQWPQGCVLVFDEDSSSQVENETDSSATRGILCPHDTKVSLPQAQVGELVEVSVPLTAPGRPGNYVSHFKFETADGIQFGHRVWVDIIVEDYDNDTNDWQILNASNSLDLSSVEDASSFACTNTVTGTQSNKQDCSKVDGDCNSKLAVPAVSATVPAVSATFASAPFVSSSSSSGTKTSTISFAAFKPATATATADVTTTAVPPPESKQWEWEIMQLTDMGLYRDLEELIPILVKHLKNPACSEGQKNRERLARVINELIDSP